MTVHPLVWLTVGALITLISYVIGGKLQLFFYIGVAFIAIGVLSGIIRILMREPKDTKRYICYRCKDPVTLGSMICARCGARLNHRHGQ